MPGSGRLSRKLLVGGFRLTLPRQAILNLFAQTPEHLTAEEVFLEIHKKYPGIGMATVYRTLDLLSRIGLLSKLDFGDGKSRYELVSRLQGEHHHHMICLNCGRIIDYSDFVEKEKEFMEELETVLSRKYRFKIQNHQVIFQGVCEKCQKSLSEKSHSKGEIKQG